MLNKLYHYKAHIVSVYDGDTVRADIDLGCGIFMMNEILRIHGINAPEVRGKERPLGLESRDFLRELILDKDVIIQTFKDKKGKYGRYIAQIQFGDKDVAMELVRSGNAVFKDY